MCRLRSTDGAALLIALMAMMLMAALATALILTTITETRIASSYGAGIEAFYAADAAIERAIDDLRTIPDWSALAAKAATSTFVDGPPGGPRTLWDGMILDLGEETRMVREGDGAPWRPFVVRRACRHAPAWQAQVAGLCRGLGGGFAGCAAPARRRGVKAPGAGVWTSGGTPLAAGRAGAQAPQRFQRDSRGFLA